MGAEQLIEAMEVADYCQVATGFALKGPYFFRRTLTDYLAYLEVKK